MSDIPKGMLTAEVAAARLQVSRATLYCYVSRGLIRTFQSPNNPRERLYPALDIESVLDRKLRLRRPRVAASTALNHGLPVLESSITQIANGKPLYRGYDAVELAGRATLEEVACLLWRSPYAGPFRTRPRPALDYGHLAGGPMERAMTALALTNAYHVQKSGSSKVIAPTESALLQIIVSAAIRADPDGHFIHRRIARAWKTEETTADCLRRALVLCADHELSASAFAVRVVASTAATLATALMAGVGALSGPKHGGEIARVHELFRRFGSAQRTLKALGEHIKAGRQVAGFGHPLYPEGDPRATALLSEVDLQRSDARVIEFVHAETGQKPALAGALVVLERSARLPAGAAQTLFSVGRTVGWIAHAKEQYTSGAIIRPRAHYVDE